MIKYEDIVKANEIIKPIEIKRKDKKTGKTIVKAYAEVTQRIKAFRMLYPGGFITTEIKHINDKAVVMVAEAGFYDENGNKRVLGTGTACEYKGSTYINDTSHIENCETSAVGRALSQAGLGIDVSIASYEEVVNAMINQNEKVKMASAAQKKFIKDTYKDALPTLLEHLNINTIDELTADQAGKVLTKIKEGGNE